MTVTDKEKTAPSGTVPTGSGVARELAACGALDDLFEQVESGKVDLTGADGLLPALLKEALERGLQAEPARSPGPQGRASRPRLPVVTPGAAPRPR